MKGHFSLKKTDRDYYYLCQADRIISLLSEVEYPFLHKVQGVLTAAQQTPTTRVEYKS